MFGSHAGDEVAVFPFGFPHLPSSLPEHDLGSWKVAAAGLNLYPAEFPLDMPSVSTLCFSEEQGRVFADPFGVFVERGLIAFHLKQIVSSLLEDLPGGGFIRVQRVSGDRSPVKIRRMSQGVAPAGQLAIAAFFLWRMGAIPVGSPDSASAKVMTPLISLNIFPSRATVPGRRPF